VISKKGGMMIQPKLWWHTAIALPILVIVLMGGCGKNEPPAPQATTGQDSHPVKNVENLPAGNIQEGARTMNRAADLGKSLELQKQDRDKEAETQNK
jgi:hypothetical protein